MEMKQISETTLKIMITMEDLEEHGMELKDFLIPQEKTEEFFYTVFRDKFNYFLSLNIIDIHLGNQFKILLTTNSIPFF